MSEARTMFGKLFGRSRKSAGTVLDSGLPATSSPPVAPTVTVAPTGAPEPLGYNGAGIDLSTLMTTVKEARSHAGNDPLKLVAELQEKLGGATPYGNVFALGGAGQPDVVGQLERLAKLHADGALTDAEFAAEKAKIIGA